MQTQTISATKARQEFFDLLNQVAMGKSFFIQKDLKKVAQIIPAVSETKSWEEEKKEWLDVIRETRGILKGERFRSPLRGKKARAWLGRWDRNLK